MNQQDSPRGGVGGVGVGCPRPAPFPTLLPGSTSRRAARPFLGGGCGQRRRRTAGLRRRVCVAGPCGAGEGARAAQTMPAGAEPAAGPPSAFTLLSLLVCRSLLFLSPLSPSPPPLLEGWGLHFNASRVPLLSGLRRAGGRGAPGSLRRLVWPGRAPPAARGFKCVFSPPRLPCLVGAQEGGGRRAGLPLLRDLSPRGRPRVQGREPGKERLALPFPVGPGGAPGPLPPEFGWRWVAGGRARGEPR